MLKAFARFTAICSVALVISGQGAFAGEEQKGSIDLDFEWIRKHHINFGVNYSNIGEDIFIDGEWFTTPDYSGYAIGYSLDTFLGPLEAKYTWSPENSENFWTFNLGFWF